MNELSQILKDVPLLQCLPPHTIEKKILTHGCLHKYEKNAAIILPQEKVNDVSIVLSGKIHMMHLFSNGHYSIFNTLNPPEALGLDLVGTPTRVSPYLAIAAEVSEVFSFSADFIFRPGILSMEECFALSTKILSMVSNFNIQKEYRLTILSQNGLRERIMTYLTMQSAKRGTDTFQIPFSREEMASFLCVNRSALSHELSLMEKDGIISFKKNCFSLLKKTY